MDYSPVDTSDQDEYNYVASLMFNWSSAVVPRDDYYFTLEEDGNAWILHLKPNVRLVPKPVYTGSAKGFIFHFQDEMTPRPFDDGFSGWKVTFPNPNIERHRLWMASPTHTFFCLHVRDNCEEIVTEEHDCPLAKLCWKQ